jgi:hypothetical protein
MVQESVKFLYNVDQARQTRDPSATSGLNQFSNYT